MIELMHNEEHALVPYTEPQRKWSEAKHLA